MKGRYIPNRKKIGEILVRQDELTAQQLTDLLRLQKTSYKPLGQLLIENGILTEERLMQILGEQLGIPHLWLRKGLVDPRIVHVLPKEKALLFQVIPMFQVNDVLTLATADPHAIFIFDEISKITGLEIQPVICRVDDILEAISECYKEDVEIDDIISSFEEPDIEVIETTSEEDISEIAKLAEENPVVNLTNKVMLKAIRDGASDIHIEPQQEKLRVRVRIDGILYDLLSAKKEMHPPLVSRLKVMAHLDISERRIPQDGRVQVRADGRKVDLRFCSMPGVHGEKVVLRVLDKSQVILDINKLGFDDTILNRFKSLLKRPYGLILVCGPTGSGKTTTLYAAISMLNTSEKNLITIEDPVEYQLESINQNQVNESIGLTFAKVLKHALRQDPDVLLVGEIRDRETAETAIQASLTGHLVLSTLHTNDSPSAITRLLEMGIAPYLISSSVMASVGQRLLRTICPECRTRFYPPKEVLLELGLDENKKYGLFRGKGCSVCYDSGFKDRTGLYEIMEIDENLQSLILSKPTIESLRNHLRNNGHKNLKELGRQKVIEGVTTFEEVNSALSLAD